MLIQYLNSAFQKHCTGSVCVNVSTVLLCVKKQIFIFRPQRSSDDFLSSLPPSLSLALLCLSLLLHCAPSPSSSPHRPCWIGGVNTGRERALFHHARAGRSCRAPAPGSKVYCGFHFTFPQPITAPHCSAWTLTPAKNSTQKMIWRQFHNCTPLPSYSLRLLFLSFNWPASCVDRGTRWKTL